MLGQIIGALTNPDMAEDVVTSVGNPEIVDRIRTAATSEGTEAGSLIASKVRHLIDHGGEAIWLDLLGVMSNTPQPGPAALDRILSYAFPDPVRVRVSRKPAA